MAMKRPLIAAFAILVCLMFAWATGAGRAHPANADGVIDPTCTSSSPCIEYDNNGTGPGIRGTSVGGNGIGGVTTFKSTSPTNFRTGVLGNDQSTSGVFDSGVQGRSVRGTGVLGTSTLGAGVSGTSSSQVGVRGTSTSSFGVAGTSASSAGVSGDSSDNYGVHGQSTNSVGVFGVSLGSQPGVSAQSFSGEGLLSTATTGAELVGTGVGAIARSLTGAGNYPLILTDRSANDLFFVNGNGDVFYHGVLSSFAVAPKGNVARTYTSKAASPMVEDTGSGQLINGVAVVKLDPAFAQTIDSRTPYHVLLTPDGDTRGLFVASKGLTGFVVREVQGGRSSLTFDYHIYAAALGHAGERMAVMTPAAAAALMPKVPIMRRATPLLTHPGSVVPAH